MPRLPYLNDVFDAFVPTNRVTDLSTGNVVGEPLRRQVDIAPVRVEYVEVVDTLLQIRRKSTYDDLCEE